MTGRLLLHVFSTFAVGGPQVRFATLANHFGAAYRHRIVAMDGQYAARELLDPGLDCEVMPMPVRKGPLIGNLRQIRQMLRAVRPALLVTYNWGTIEWGLANLLPPAVPHVHIEDGFGPEEAAGQLRRRVLMRRLALSRTRAVLLPSRRLYDIAANVWRLPRAKLRYVPNGIDDARFARSPDPALVATLGIQPGEGIVGTVAALRAEKNLGRLLDAFATVVAARPARLVIVGDGPQRPALEARAAALCLGERVVFTGRLAEPERILGAFDVFALSSDTEQMPISVLEAMAAGLPLAATDVGDVRQMLALENAPFVVSTEVSPLAAALDTLLSDAERRRLVGTANRVRVGAEYAQAKMFADWEELFNLGR